MKNEAEVVETELLSCPFCGSHAHVRSTRIPPDSSLRAYWVECVVCEVGTKYHDSDSGAAATWNTRVSTSADIRTQALEDAAKGCEDLVTFASEHEQYVPADPNANCGWCDGLEEAAKRIRALIPNNEAEKGK